MARKFLLTILALSSFLWWMTSPTPTLSAQQDDETCPTFVEDALKAVGNACELLGRDEACYGNFLVEATPWNPDADFAFTAPADRANLVDLKSVATSPLDLEQQQWGVAVMSLQANLPEMLPGQAVTFLLMGDVAVENHITPEQAAAMDADITATVTEEADLLRCPFPDGVVLGTAAANTEISLIGRSEDLAWYQTLLSSGQKVWVTSSRLTGSDLDTLPITYGTDISPDCGAMQAFYFTMGLGAPQCEEAPSAMVVQTPQGLEVAFNVNGLDITAGSSVALFVAQLADGANALITILFEGHLKDQLAQSQAPRGPVGQTDAHDCGCVATAQANLPGTAFAIPLNADGTVDANAGFIPFTGDQQWVEKMVKNACNNANLAGVFGREIDCNFNLNFYTPCTVTPSNTNVNQRGGPGTNYVIKDVLGLGENATVNGYTTGTDGTTWWQILGGDGRLCNWISDAVVQSAGSCDNAPSFGAPEAEQRAAKPQPQQPALPPGTEVKHYDVYNCTPNGDGTFWWWVVEETFVNGISQGIKILDRKSGPWQPGCPTAWCGNGICDGLDSYWSCPQDCPEPPPPGCNNNGWCEGYNGEDCTSCPGDCGKCPQYPTCGNGKCESNLGENCENCPADCKSAYCYFTSCAYSAASGACAVDCPGGVPSTNPICMSCLSIWCSYFYICS